MCVCVSSHAPLHVGASETQYATFYNIFAMMFAEPKAASSVYLDQAQTVVVANKVVIRNSGEGRFCDACLKQYFVCSASMNLINLISSTKKAI